MPASEITRAEWMESARKRLEQAGQFTVELLEKWPDLTNEERLKGLTQIETKLNDCIIMVKGRTIFKNGD